MMKTHSEIFIPWLTKQRDLLTDLITELERKENLSDADAEQYDHITKQVQHNLKRLRKLNREFNHFDV